MKRMTAIANIKAAMGSVTAAIFGLSVMRCLCSCPVDVATVILLPQ